MNPFLFLFQSGLDFVSSTMRAKSQQDAFSANSEELRRAAYIEEARAVDAVARGGVQASRIRQEGARAAAEARQALVAGNVELSTGTAATAQEASSMLSEFDAQLAKNNAAREAFGFRESARRLNAQKKQLTREYQADALNQFIGFGARTTERVSGFATASTTTRKR